MTKLELLVNQLNKVSQDIQNTDEFEPNDEGDYHRFELVPTTDLIRHAWQVHTGPIMGWEEHSRYISYEAALSVLKDLQKELESL